MNTISAPGGFPSCERGKWDELLEEGEGSIYIYFELRHNLLLYSRHDDTSKKKENVGSLFILKEGKRGASTTSTARRCGAFRMRMRNGEDIYTQQQRTTGLKDPSVVAPFAKTLPSISCDGDSGWMDGYIYMPSLYKKKKKKKKREMGRHLAPVSVYIRPHTYNNHNRNKEERGREKSDGALCTS